MEAFKVVIDAYKKKIIDYYESLVEEKDKYDDCISIKPEFSRHVTSKIIQWRAGYNINLDLDKGEHLIQKGKRHFVKVTVN